ncbi:PO113 protein, partial [Orthonyx spaldingii]|nr:PO113 protein [Orthonyx spaldingii]
LVKGNAYIDSIVSASADTTPSKDLTPLQVAQQLHAFFHQSALALKRQFGISHADARAVVAACPECARVMPIQNMGVNPRGLQSRSLWQSDVTEFAPFGVLRYIHVTVDTCSKAIWATPM